MVKQIFIDLQKFKCYSLWSMLPFEIKKSEYFAVNHALLKLSFWKLPIERSFAGKKLMIEIFDCTF